MLVCYLDDSGTDPQNRIVTVAGYVATEEQWHAFETEVEPIFDQYNVGVLHTKDLHDTDGTFKDWQIISKQAFVARICSALSHHVPLGVSMSALKGTYDVRAAKSDRKRTITPYTFCFAVIIDWLLRNITVGRAGHTEGLAFILESGNKNNPEAEAYFNGVRKLHGLDTVLRSISFIGKNACRAIQMADLVAFYSRRHGLATEKAPLDERPQVSPGTMMNIIAERVPHLSFVATDFGPHVLETLSLMTNG